MKYFTEPIKKAFTASWNKTIFQKKKIIIETSSGSRVLLIQNYILFLNKWTKIKKYKKKLTLQVEISTYAQVYHTHSSSCREEHSAKLQVAGNAFISFEWLLAGVGSASTLMATLGPLVKEQQGDNL